LKFFIIEDAGRMALSDESISGKRFIKIRSAAFFPTDESTDDIITASAYPLTRHVIE
jgi:hypothetical protein